MKIPTDDAARKRLQFWTYLMEYFPDAFMAEVEVAVAGNEQHNRGQPLHWAREKSKDQMNTAFRHMLDYGSGVKKDTDGQWHLAKAIWRLKAQLQLDIEAECAAEKQVQENPAGDLGPVCGESSGSYMGAGFCDMPPGHDGMHRDSVRKTRWL